MRVALVVLVVVLAGCSPSVGPRTECAEAATPIPDGTVPVVPRCPGECDPMAARTLVYDQSGLPLYAGQALLLQTCAGSGGYCHASDASDRYGAPGEMNFDLVPLTSAGEAARRQELGLNQRLVFDQRDAIWSQLLAGTMPPGAAGRENIAADFGYVVDPLDPAADVVLAQLDTAEGREILRNWLACGAPIVERTVAVPPTACATDAECVVGSCTDGACSPLGAEVPILDRTP